MAANDVTLAVPEIPMLVTSAHGAANMAAKSVDAGLPCEVPNRSVVRIAPIAADPSLPSGPIQQVPAVWPTLSPELPGSFIVSDGNASTISTHWVYTQRWTPQPDTLQGHSIPLTVLSHEDICPPDNYHGNHCVWSTAGRNITGMTYQTTSSTAAWCGPGVNLAAPEIPLTTAGAAIAIHSPTLTSTPDANPAAMVVANTDGDRVSESDLPPGIGAARRVLWALMAMLAVAVVFVVAG